MKRMLPLYRREDMAVRWPAELGGDLAGLNAAIDAALRSDAISRDGDDSPVTRRLILALIDVPCGATRRHLVVGEAPPPELDGLIAQACGCRLADASKMPPSEC